MDKGIAQLEDRKSPLPRRIRKGRRATKAARAMLRLAPDGLKRQARGLTMALSGVRRMLADSRDADALVETLNSLSGEVAATPRMMAQLLRPLKAHQPIARAAQADECTRASAAMQKIRVQIAGWKVPRGRGAMILAAIGEDDRRLRRDAAPGLDRLDAEDLHDLRKRIITHRHQLALLASYTEAEDAARITRRMERAKALQKVIGEHRDLHLLNEYLRGLAQPSSHDVRQKMLEVIAKRQKEALRQAIGLEEKLAKQKRRAVLAPARKRMG